MTYILQMLDELKNNWLLKLIQLWTLFETEVQTNETPYFKGFRIRSLATVDDDALNRQYYELMLDLISFKLNDSDWSYFMAIIGYAWN